MNPRPIAHSSSLSGSPVPRLILGGGAGMLAGIFVKSLERRATGSRRDQKRSQASLK
jgi:hypothetical protein